MGTMLKNFSALCLCISLLACSLPQPPKKVPSRPSAQPSEHDLLGQARVALKFGDPRGAMNLASKSIKKNPKNPHWKTR